MKFKRILLIDYQSTAHYLFDERVKEIQKIKKSIIYVTNRIQNRDTLRKTRKKYLNLLLQIGAYLKDFGFEVFYVSVPDENELFTEKLKWADAVFFWVKTSYYVQAKTILENVKQAYPEKLTVMGGYHATGLPEKVLRELPGVDFLTIGESERALLKLLRGDAPDSIRGIAYRVNGTILIDREPELLAPYEIKAPDYSLLNGDRKKYRYYLQTTRGCPYRCKYCVYGFYWKSIREMSPECIRQDLEQIKSIMGSTLEMHLTDNIVSYDMENVRRVTEIIRELGMNISFSADIRAEYAQDIETLNALWELGVRKLFIGFEDADEVCRQSAGRLTSEEDFLKALSLMKQANIAVGCYWMMGLPGTTKESFSKNITFARKLIRERLIETLCADIVFTPRPGTPLYNEAEQFGIYDIEDDWTGFRRSNYWPNYSLRTISKKDMYEGFLQFDEAVIDEQLKQLGMTADEVKEAYFSSGCVEAFLL